MAEVELPLAIINGVPSLVTNCATLLGYIQHARHLERDHKTLHLQFEAANARLSHWARADVNEDTYVDTNPAHSAGSARHPKQSIFQQIRKLLERTDRLLRRYKRVAASENVDPFMRIFWAVCDRRELEELAAQVSSLVDNLEQLYPVRWYTWALSRMRRV